MYKVHFPLNNTDIVYLNSTKKESPHVIEIGHSTPPPGYTSKYLTRNVFVLHYVISGKGRYYGQQVIGPCVFLECPNTVHYYEVDQSEGAPPWEQYWIMFAGNGVSSYLSDAGFQASPSCYPCPYMNRACDILHHLQAEKSYFSDDEHFLTLAALFSLFSLHAASAALEQPKQNNVYVRTIRSYIRDNYATISCEKELAELVHLSTRYMHKIFKEEMGESPMRYLNQYRIRCAKKLLTETNIPIHTISEMVGFSNPNYFCCVFQRFCDGISPLTYRKGKHRS